MKLIFATHNQGKVKEMKAMLVNLGVEIASMEEAGIKEEIVEDGNTFEENALKKARLVARQTGEWTVADDSGICIAALEGAPGIYSARFGGAGMTAKGIVSYTLEQMKNVPEGKRQAWFETALALIAPDGRERVFHGKVDGRVAQSPRGTPRPKLPYDVIFIPRGHTRTFAGMSDAEKNSMSHRGRAFVKLKFFLKTLL